MAAVLAALIGSAGCYKATFIRDPSAVKTVEGDQWLSFFLWGLVGEPTVDVTEFCAKGRVAEVQTRGDFLTGLVSFLTLGIYWPRKVIVTCAADGRALELQFDESGRLVAFAEVRR